MCMVWRGGCPQKIIQVFCVKECILVHFLQRNIELLVSDTYASAVPGTKLSPARTPGTRTVAGTDNPSGGESPVPPLIRALFIWHENLGKTFLRFVTIHAFDRRTDERTDGLTEWPWQYRALHYIQSHGKN